MATDYCLPQGYWFESSRRSSTSEDTADRSLGKDRFLVYSFDPHQSAVQYWCPPRLVVPPTTERARVLSAREPAGIGSLQQLRRSSRSSCWCDGGLRHRPVRPHCQASHGFVSERNLKALSDRPGSGGFRETTTTGGVLLVRRWRAVVLCSAGTGRVRWQVHRRRGHLPGRPAPSAHALAHNRSRLTRS